MKLLFISLGCDKNLVDTEFMLGMIRDAGTFDGQPIEMTDDEYQADIIIINTCCFINDAKEESINTILEMAEKIVHMRDESDTPAAVSKEADTVFILYDVYTIRLANDIRDKMIEREKEGETK